MKYYLKSETMIIDGLEFTQEVKKTFKKEKNQKPVDVFVENKCFIPEWLVTTDLQDILQRSDQSIQVTQRVDKMFTKIFEFVPAVNVVQPDTASKEKKCVVKNFEKDEKYVFWKDSATSRRRGIDEIRFYLKNELGEGYSASFDAKVQAYKILCGDAPIFMLQISPWSVIYQSFSNFGENYPFKKEDFLSYIKFMSPYKDQKFEEGVICK